jgi:hypothetical protein
MEIIEEREKKKKRSLTPNQTHCLMPRGAQKNRKTD